MLLVDDSNERMSFQPKTESELAQVMTQYLESDIHARFVETRIQAVIDKYPEYIYDRNILEGPGETYIEVRAKWDWLRSANLDVENDLMARSTEPKRAQNQHISRLLSFMWAYVQALGQREAEIEIIKKLAPILDQELGNYSGDIADIGRLFMDGIGNAIGGIVKFGMDLFDQGVNGIAKAMGVDPKVVKIIVIGVIILAGVSGVAVLVAKFRRKRSDD